MFDHLLESKQARGRKPSGTITSVLLHAVVIGAAAHSGERAVLALFDSTERVVCRIAQIEGSLPVVDSEWRDPVLHDAVTTVVAVDEHFLPWPTFSIPLPAPPDDPTFTEGNSKTLDFTGISEGDVDAFDVLSREDQIFFDFQVDRVAESIPSTPRPTYPEALEDLGLEGEALVQFVVDTSGLAEIGSFKILRTSRAEFGESVRATLPDMRYLPAEIGGRKVRMLIQRPFAFTLNR